jgi:RNA polymerase sigma-70 factor, ECF subfamily
MDIRWVEVFNLEFSALDDEALLAVIAAEFGRPSAESIVNEAVLALYDRYGKLIYSVAYHSTGNIETAEEITQDVFVRVCKNAHTYRSEKGKVINWLVSITRHSSIDELRRRRIRPEHTQVQWIEDGWIESMVETSLPDSPEQIAEANIQQHQISQIIAELPLQQRQVLFLAFFKGLSHSQIADRLGEPLGTVKSRVRLAMQKLRDRLIDLGIVE